MKNLEWSPCTFSGCSAFSQQFIGRRLCTLQYFACSNFSLYGLLIAPFIWRSSSSRSCVRAFITNRVGFTLILPQYLFFCLVFPGFQFGGTTGFFSLLSFLICLEAILNDLFNVLLVWLSFSCDIRYTTWWSSRFFVDVSDEHFSCIDRYNTGGRREIVFIQSHMLCRKKLLCLT